MLFFEVEYLKKKQCVLGQIYYRTVIGKHP